jgi:peptide/nickel transport system ATP-binding protein
MSARPGMTPGRPLLEVRGLCVDYGAGPDAVHAVRDADLTLHGGEVLGLAGESGSGKSTLAYAVTRLLRAPGIITGGTARFWPEPDRPADLLALSEQQLRVLRWSAVSVVMQSAMNSLNPVLSIGAQLTDVLRAHVPGQGRTGRRARAAELLAMVGIPAGRLTSYPHELSGGMRQRVMIAMALALEPQVVIMDEPTTALDVVTQREILEELMELREKLRFAVLFITHDLSLLIEIADSIAVMYAGRLVEQASASALFRAPRHPYTLGLLSSFPALHGEHEQLTGIPGSPPSPRHLPAGCVFHPRCGFAIERCRTEAPPLLPPSGEAGRLAACWRQDGAGPAPPELARPVRDSDSGPGPAEPADHGGLGAPAGLAGGRRWPAGVAGEAVQPVTSEGGPG